MWTASIGWPLVIRTSTWVPHCGLSQLHVWFHTWIGWVSAVALVVRGAAVASTATAQHASRGVRAARSARFGYGMDVLLLDGRWVWGRSPSRRSSPAPRRAQGVLRGGRLPHLAAAVRMGTRGHAISRWRPVTPRITDRVRSLE